jgi:hypothetical protein
LFEIVMLAGIAGIQAPVMGLSFPSMALNTCFPAGDDELTDNLTK